MNQAWHAPPPMRGGVVPARSWRDASRRSRDLPPHIRLPTGRPIPFRLNPVVAAQRERAPAGTGRARLIACLPLLAWALSSRIAAAPGNDVFDATFLRLPKGETVDVSRFATENAIVPGIYSVQVLVNGVRHGRMDIWFASTGNDAVRPCIGRKMLQDMGVDFQRFEEGGAPHAGPAIPSNACGDVLRTIPDAASEFDFSQQSLSLTIPQSFMRSNPRGYVSPERWDYGVDTAFLNYNASAFHSSIDGRSSTHAYLGLNAGVNLDGWRLRSLGSLISTSAGGTHYDNIATYLQHDVQWLRSQATLGDAYTSGEVFDSVAFRGVQLATDDRMLPDSQRGFAPVVRGMAQTNARVTIRQNGQVIYETRVSPGPFEISDLYATGYGGNLEVTVTEADGRSNRFAVPYAAVPQSLRPGITRFAATAGRLRSDHLRERPNFAQLTLQHGISNTVTGYGGVLAANGYSAVNIGAALNTPYGAFGGDVTVARTDIPGQAGWRGTSWRGTYSKFFESSGTNFALAAYRQSTEHYLSFADAAALRDVLMEHGTVDYVARQRDRLQITVNQSLQDWGAVYLTVASQKYWNRERSDTFFQAGYTNTFAWGSYSLTAGRTRDAVGRMSTQVGLSVTIPLGQSGRAPLMTTNFSRDDGRSQAQAGLSGSLGQEDQFSYNVYAGYNQGGGNSGGGNAGASGMYRAAWGQATASASTAAGATQTSAGMSGAVVAHPGGVSLSQPVGDTFGVVHAPGAEGARITNAPGVRVDGNGYAVVPYLMPYSMNTVSIDPKGASTQVEFASTSEQAVPRDGAVPLVRFQTVTGRAALIDARRPDGKPVPFGADVKDQDGRVVGVAAQGNRIFARGLQDQGVLTVQWGEGAKNACRIAYALPDKSRERDAYERASGLCVPVAAPVQGALPGQVSASSHSRHTQ